MPTRQRLRHLIGQPVGITFTDGTGISGVLCSFNRHTITIRVFQIGTFFPLNTIRISRISRIRRFPRCPR